MTNKKKIAKIQNHLRPKPRKRHLVPLGAGFFTLGFLAAGALGAVLDANQLRTVVADARARFVNAQEDGH